MTEIIKNKVGRPKGENKVRSIRCSDTEFEQIKAYLKQLRTAKQTATAEMAELEAKGQQKLKF